MQTRRILLVMVLLTAAWAGKAQAAEPDPAIVPTRGFHPAHTYSISDIESIDQASGTLSLHIPITQLPPGSAGFTAGLTLAYTSKYWNTYPSPGSQLNTYRYFLVPSEHGTWHLGLTPWIELRWIEDSGCPSLDGIPNADDHFRLSVIEPDGSSHLLHWNQWPGTTAGYCMYSFLNVTTSTVWYSTDGSFLQVEFDASTQGIAQFDSWTIRRNDGTSVRNDATLAKTYLRDRNQNEITVVWDVANSEDYSAEMEDAFGRKIRIADPLPGPGGQVQTLITQVGNDENTQNPLTWTLTYESLPATTTPPIYECVEDQLQGTWADNICPLPTPPPVVNSLQLPNGLLYQFAYGARYKELSRLTLPTGATVDYVYYLDAPQFATDVVRFYRILGNALKSKTVTYGGTTEAWNYSNSDDANADAYERTWRTATAPDGGTTRSDFFGLAHYWPGGTISPLGGLVTKITRQDGSIREREWAYSYPPAPGGTELYPNRWIKTECETQVNSSGAPVSTSVRVHTTDKNGNITSTKEHDWTAPGGPCVPESAGPLLRKTVMTYVNGAQDSTYGQLDPNAYSHTIATSPRNLVALRETQNASGTVLARSELSYQEATPSRMVGNLVRQYDWDNTRPNPDPNQNQIGACTTPTVPNSCPPVLTTSKAIQREYTYTTRGNLLTEKDPNGNQITYSYVAIPNCPNASADSTDLYRTGMQRGGISSVLQQWTYAHKCISGLPEQVTDPNGLTTVTSYDRYGRPTQVTDGTLRTTRHTYPPDISPPGQSSNLYVVTTSDVLANGDQKNVSVSRFDQLGRPRLTQQLEQMTTPQAVAGDESLGIKTEMRYKFSSGINAVLVSNPYRASDPGALTRGWTATRRDKVGRTCSVETFDDSTEPTLAQNCAPSPAATGGTQYTYDATATFTEQTVTETTPDPNDVARKLRSDVLGRLLTVIEDPAGANYPTSYAFDLRDNLISVAQGATARSFVYSSLNRLLTATNPETGTTPVAFSYDLAGNLVTRTMDGGLVRCHGTWNGSTCLTTGPDAGYDDLNRLRKTTYNDGTATVEFTYDTAQTADRPAGCTDTGPKGRLAKVTNGTFTTFYFYNQLGHTVCSRQRIQTYDPFDFLYTNTPQGEWATVKYPSGRTLTTAFDDAGRTTSLTGNFQQVNSPYASNLKYAAHGAIGQVTLGNGTVETSSYNGRLQLTHLKLGSSPGSNGAGTTDRWWLQNCYTDADPCVGSGPANNGNVRYQKLTVLNGTTVKTLYRYDGLNRLKLANETPTSLANPLCPDAGSHWCQQYGYDARGNRRVEAESNLGFVLGRPDTFGPDNRIADAGFGYDARGNLTLLPTGERYLYDGENRQVVYCASFVSASDCTNPAVTVGKTFYYYDGEGRRVGKVSGSVTEIFVYDAASRLAAEYGGAAVETATHYVTADHLGSTRVVTDVSKAVLQCKDYLPFGDEILATTQNGRGSIGCYSGETGLRQKFTGKERDPESRLDYFEARYYSSAAGRFNSPDPDNISGFLYPDDPQSWNGYAYGRNNPLLYTDPEGLAYEVCEVDDQGKKFNCGVIKDDRQFDDYAKEKGWYRKGGKLYDKDGNVIGTAEWFDTEPLEALIRGTQQAKPIADATAMATMGFVGAGLVLEVGTVYAGVQYVPGWFNGLVGHHGIPRFLGGLSRQALSSIPKGLHKEFHALLRQALREGGFPLNVGGRGGSTGNWAEYMLRRPGSQQSAFDAVIRAAQKMDIKYGTQLVREFLSNVGKGNFNPF